MKLLEKSLLLGARFCNITVRFQCPSKGGDIVASGEGFDDAVDGNGNRLCIAGLQYFRRYTFIVRFWGRWLCRINEFLK